MICSVRISDNKVICISVVIDWICVRTEAVARVQPDRDRLGELGFKYKYGMEEILDSSVACAARLGSLDASKLSVQKG